MEARALGCAYDAQMMSSASPAIAMRNKKSTIVSAKLRGGGNSTGSHAHASHASRIFFDCFWISSSPDLTWRFAAGSGLREWWAETAGVARAERRIAAI